MPDDIFIQLDTASIGTQKKPRWYYIAGMNPLGALPSLQYLGETVLCNDDGEPVAAPVRDDSLDMTIPFDPSNAKHVQAMTLLDEIIKEAYNATQIRS